MKRVFSVWKNESTNGNEYFTGKIGDLSIIGFYNTEKKNSKQPDLTFYVREEKGNTNAINDTNDNSYSEFEENIELTDDDIAF